LASPSITLILATANVTHRTIWLVLCACVDCVYRTILVGGESKQTAKSQFYVPPGSLAEQKAVKCSDYEALFEMATICSMCNESSVDYNEVCN